MLYNNGYVIKDLIDNEDLSLSSDVYRGIENYHSWPLETQKDSVSLDLTKQLEKHFDENDYVEILKDVNLLKKYVKHCKELGIDVVIFKIMTANNSLVTNVDLKEIEVLGYDCIVGGSVSYLTEVFCDELEKFELFNKTKKKVNSNGLLNSYDEAEVFIKEREKLIEQGLNLEAYWKAVPARLSIVTLD